MEFTKHDIERFWNKIKIGSANECWPWLGCYDFDGYGQFRLNYQTFSTHRLAWFLTFGQVPKDENGKTLCVCHHCDNPFCCNPSHFFVGTQKDNIADAVIKKRMIKPKDFERGENNPHSILTEKQVKEIKNQFRIGILTQKEIAEENGVKHQAISKIKLGLRWSHIR